MPHRGKRRHDARAQDWHLKASGVCHESTGVSIGKEDHSQTSDMQTLYNALAQTNLICDGVPAKKFMF